MTTQVLENTELENWHTPCNIKGMEAKTMEIEEALKYIEKEFDNLLTVWAKKGNEQYLFHWVDFGMVAPRELRHEIKMALKDSKEYKKMIRRVLKKHRAYFVKVNTSENVWFEDGTEDQPKRAKI